VGDVGAKRALTFFLPLVPIMDTNEKRGELVVGEMEKERGQWPRVGKRERAEIGCQRVTIRVLNKGFGMDE